MPITSGFVSRSTVLKGKGHIHTDKWHRCVEKVKAKSPGVEPHAVCTSSIGYEGSINPEHRRKVDFAHVLRGKGDVCVGPPKEGHLEKRKKHKNKYIEALKFDESQVNRQPAGASGGHGGEFAKSGTGGGTGDGSKEKTKGSKKTRTSGGSMGSKLTPAQHAMQRVLKEQSRKRIHKVNTPEEGVALILKGERVEIKDTKDVHTVLSKLGEMAIKAKEACGNKQPCEGVPNFDPCLMTVKGTSLFCSEKIKTKEFPHGVPRIEMPQFKSKNPVPGSEADKLPRDAGGEVNGTQAFLDHLLETEGVTSKDTTVKASKLKASQAEMEGAKVAGMMLDKKRDPKKQRITVSRDGYVVDGHHTWAAAVGRDAEDGNLDNDMEMEVVMIDMPMSDIYHASVAWTKKYGLPAAGVKKQEFARFLHAVA